MKATFLCFEDPEADDDTTCQLRQQLRDMYQWIPGAPEGEPNIQIVCRAPRAPELIEKQLRIAAAELQESIHLRVREECEALRTRGFGYPRDFVRYDWPLNDTEHLDWMQVESRGAQ